ncbi:MAG: exosortase-associated EpsI family protein [Planctomycetota bacterium]|jgi:hypothetical protein
MNFDRQAKSALIVASLTLAVCGVGFRFAVRAANAYLEKKPVQLRDQLANIPKRLGAWSASGQDLTLTAEVEEVLGTDQYLDRMYVRERSGRQDAALGVHIAYYTGLIDAVPHVADRCLAAAGWVKVGLPVNLDVALDRSGWEVDVKHVNLGSKEPYPVLTFRHHVTGQPVTVRMPIGDFKLRTTEFRASNHPDMRIYAGYLFIANGTTTPSPEKVRSFAFDLRTRYAYYAKVQFSMYVAADVEADAFADVASDLLAELLPELMRCLPDWAEVESWSRDASKAPAA